MNIIQQHFLLPAVIGIVTGVAKFTITKIALGKIDQIFDNVVSASVANHLKGLEEISLFQRVVIAPFIEEALFRAGLNSLLFLSFSQLGMLSIQARLIAAIAQSIIFGALHYTNDYDRISAIQAAFAVLGGLQYSYLNHHFGFVACLLSHMTNNLFCYYFPYTNPNAGLFSNPISS